GGRGNPRPPYRCELPGIDREVRVRERALLPAGPDLDAPQADALDGDLGRVPVAADDRRPDAEEHGHRRAVARVQRADPPAGRVVPDHTSAGTEVARVRA